MREKIESIPHHITNRHFHPENEHFRHCEHGDLAEEGRDRDWMDPESPVRM